MSSNPTDKARDKWPSLGGSDFLQLLDSGNNRIGWIDPNGALQGSLAPTGSLVSPVTSPNPLAFDVNVAFKGKNPYTDVTRYGVRGVNASVAPAVPGITGTINAGSSILTLSAASTFQNGDGIDVFFAGPACTLTTPTGLTVTPSNAAGPTMTGVTVADAGTGATTYNYQIIARDKAGSFTAASSVATTATGQATLGAQGPISISVFTKS